MPRLLLPRFIALLSLSAMGAVRPLAAADVTYYQDVRPLLRKHCTICHNKGNLDETDVSGGLALDQPAAFLDRRTKPIVVPGQPARSELYLRLISKDPERQMPKDNQPLPAAQIATIRQWIEGNAKLGEPTLAPGPRRSAGPRPLKDLTISLDATPAAGLLLGRARSAPLALVAKVAPLAPVTALAYSPDGKYLASGQYRQVLIWDRERGTATVLTDPAGMVHDLEFTPDSKTLWLAGGNPSLHGEIRAYAVGSWKPVADWDEASDVVYSLAVSPNGQQVAFTCFDRMLRIYDVGKKKVVHQARAHSDTPYGVAYSRDGKHLATAGKDTAVKIWNAATGKQERSLSGHTRDVLAVLFAPDGNKVYSTGLEAQIHRWDLGRGGGATIQGGLGGSTYQMSWNARWEHFITGSSDQQVRIWSADARLEKTLRGAGDVVYSVALSPDGKTAAAGSADGLVHVWNVASGKVLLTLLAAERESSETTDWLALAATGDYSASAAFGERAGWVVAGQQVAWAKAAEVLARPLVVAKAFRGEPPIARPTAGKAMSANDRPAAGNTKNKPAKAGAKAGQKSDQ